MLKSVLNDRRLWLLIVVVLSVVVFARWIVEPTQGYGLVVRGGYWFMLVLVGLFLRAAGPLAWARFRAATYGRFELGVAGLIMVTVVTWTAHDKPGFKILADESLLCGTAMGLHYEREAAYPNRATDVQGSFQVLAAVLDKRPLLFPFLVATIHDLTGYRVENAFYLNMVFGGGFLWLIYLLGWRISGERWAGVAALLLFAGLPLLAQQSTGAGFDLLNLLLIVVFALLLVVYLEKPDDESRLEAFIYGALLLASTRYESLLLLPLAGLAALVGWQRAGKVVLSWPLMLSPIFLLPILIQNRIFAGASGAWEMASMNATKPFGFQYLAPNLGHALAFFFDLSGAQPNSPLFAIMGLLSLPFFGLWIIRVVRQGRQVAMTDLAWAITGMGLLGILAVHMFYFWGQFDHPVIRRLSLPVHLLLLVATLVMGARLLRSARAWKAVVLVVVGGMLFHSMPVMARQAYRTTYSPGVEYQLRQDFLSTLADRNVLLIDNDAHFWILHHICASPAKNLDKRKEGLIYHLRNHSFQAVYVFQSILVDEQTGKRSVDPEDDIGPDFELETVWEKKVRTLLFARISRITAIKREGQIAAQAEPFVNVSKEKRTPEEFEKARVRYIENWIKQLP